MNILVTGFTPFGGEVCNPSWSAAAALPDRINGAKLFKRELPTAFESAPAALYREVGMIDPDVILCLGQYGGSPAIRVERVAVNLMDARIPDNSGFQPKDLPVVPGGPAAYFSTLPTREIVQALCSGGIPAVLSYSAGTYVCNSLLYSALHLCACRLPAVRCGFLHVPFLPEQAAARGAGEASMSLDTVNRALEVTIRTILEH